MRQRAALFWLPALILLGAFGVICLHFHTPWPFPLVVHEDGTRTLWGTILYFEHAVQELPVDVLLAAGIAGAMLRCGAVSRKRPGLIRWLLALAVVVDATILAGAWAQAGVATSLRWLLQFHTRDSAPLAFGSHWGYHLLSEAALMLLGMALAAAAGRARGSAALLGAAWAVFAVLSLALVRNAAPFLDARYLGHQARETLTHALVSVPLAVAACCAAGGAGFSLKPISRRMLWPAAGFVLLSVYLAAGAVWTGSGQHAQTNDPVKLLCSHFFEHSFSYLVVSSHAALFLLLAARRPL
jgi:hypothetical protein